MTPTASRTDIFPGTFPLAHDRAVLPGAVGPGTVAHSRSALLEQAIPRAPEPAP